DPGRPDARHTGPPVNVDFDYTGIAGLPAIGKFKTKGLGESHCRARREDHLLGVKARSILGLEDKSVVLPFDRGHLSDVPGCAEALGLLSPGVDQIRTSNPFGKPIMIFDPSTASLSLVVIQDQGLDPSFGQKDCRAASGDATAYDSHIVLHPCITSSNNVPRWASSPSDARDLSRPLSLELDLFSALACSSRLLPTAFSRASQRPRSPRHLPQASFPRARITLPASAPYSTRSKKYEIAPLPKRTTGSPCSSCSSATGRPATGASITT